MAIRHLDAAPKAEDFTPLEEHQQQTPATFFGSKPVLYARYAGLTLTAPASPRPPYTRPIRHLGQLNVLLGEEFTTRNFKTVSQVG